MVTGKLLSAFLTFHALATITRAGTPSGEATLPPHRADRVLVMPGPDLGPGEFKLCLDDLGLGIESEFKALDGLTVVRVPPGSSVPQVIQRLEATRHVAFAEPDYLVQICATPDDPRFMDGSLWGLRNTGQSGGAAGADIDAVRGWDLQTSASHVVVAVLDTGIRKTHEDLAANLWTNPVDGTPGLNAFTGSHDPEDDNGHGTMVSGILGAVGNNGKGVTGVAWKVQIMALKCLDASGNGSDATVIACLEFARTNGARIVNASFDSPGYSQSLSNALSRLRDDGILVVASAGNNGLDLDAHPRYPACYDLENILRVAYTTRTDQLGSTSNYGATRVDLAAPGGAAQLAFFAADNSYLPGGFLTGSSFAAPHVSGAAALVMERFPAISWRGVLERIVSTADPLSSLAGRCRSSGRLNLRRVLEPYARLSIDRSRPEGVRFMLDGDPGTRWIVETSADLKQWGGSVTNTLPATGSWVGEPGTPLGSDRFFRARLSP